MNIEDVMNQLYLNVKGDSAKPDATYSRVEVEADVSVYGCCSDRAIETDVSVDVIYEYEKDGTPRGDYISYNEHQLEGFAEDIMNATLDLKGKQ